MGCVESADECGKLEAFWKILAHRWLSHAERRSGRFSAPKNPIQGLLQYGINTRPAQLKQLVVDGVLLLGGPIEEVEAEAGHGMFDWVNLILLARTSQDLEVCSFALSHSVKIVDRLR